MAHESEPGTLTVRVVDDVEAVTEIDMHAALPARALAVAKALGGLPARVLFIGCEPDHATLEELVIGLSPRVSQAADAAVRRIQHLLAEPAHA